MSQWPADQACPLNLDYPEPGTTFLDLGPILTRGRRIRRRRALALPAAGLVACTAIASVFAGSSGYLASVGPAATTGPAASRPPATIDALIASNPPANRQLTLVSTWPRHWTTVAWATRGGSVCWGTYNAAMHGVVDEFECPGWTPADVPGEGARGLSPLLPGTFPGGLSDGSDLVPEFGLTTPSASRVTVTFLGKDFSANVVPVPLRGGKTVGFFIVWLRIPPNVSSYRSSQLTREIAYDRGGRVVARHGRWP